MVHIRAIQVLRRSAPHILIFGAGSCSPDHCIRDVDDTYVSNISGMEYVYRHESDLDLFIFYIRHCGWFLKSKVSAVLVALNRVGHRQSQTSEPTVIRNNDQRKFAVVMM